MEKEKLYNTFDFQQTTNETSVVGSELEITPFLFLVISVGF